MKKYLVGMVSMQYIIGVVFTARIGLGKVGWGLGLAWDGIGYCGR